MTQLRFKVLAPLYVCLNMVFAAGVWADGMRPETTVIVLNESEGEVSINVTNTDGGPALLHSTIEDIPEDLEPLVLITPPVARVDAGEQQMVRFLAIGKEPLKTQRLKRVSFEGVPQTRPGSGATIGISLRQNLPLILHPKGLPRNEAPWELLTWQLQASTLIVRNDSPYVVRLGTEVKVNPQKIQAILPRAYILPGEVLRVDLKKALPDATSVTLEPATIYGFTVDSYDALLLANAP
ncbi:MULTISPECIES: fimbria/pilus chaperone family protein [unclassified Pseudomonas]|jgi:P pilus assembly chaperone PapD|uniref:fimbria/pilus chaperone family protein n=1 Tax=unclassified Pseudomonas TaxID=196821 RepID=UPI00096BA5DF|nr:MULTISPECIES: fimbria/pilus chaperone family protein [unclassified Pseudomonas]MDY0836393.1 fimbria/pilus chaperone family protein [Pseudomonas sp. SED1]NIL17791.1 fimbria/pilus periplasmic chaperone [Pseudomonas sp. AN3A02]